MNDVAKLSRLDRYFLSNQLRILEALYPDEAKEIAIRREALECGYEMLYDWDMEFIYEGEDKMSIEESKEVWNTMDMFDAIDRSIKVHGPEIVDGMSFLQFAGYDGNSESKFMSFAAFTVERLGRFSYLPMNKKGYWNSHMPVRPVYNRMLAEWFKISSSARFDLSAEQLISIARAAIHPENR